MNATGTAGAQQIVTVIANAGNFGDVCLGDFKDLNLTISNSGGCDLAVSGISSSDIEFQEPGVTSFPLVIAAGDNVAVPIRFKPTSIGAKNATITITP